MYPYLLVAVGGALGSMARYGAGTFIGRLVPTDFPLGTLLINITGSLAMGLFIGWLARTTPNWQADARLFVAVGILGGYTTFSSFSLDAVTLFERGDLAGAAVYALGSVIVSLLALFAGLWLMRLGVKA